MKVVQFLVIIFLLFVGFTSKCIAQHLTVPIPFKDWVKNYNPNDTIPFHSITLTEMYFPEEYAKKDTIKLPRISSLDEIPIAFFMKDTTGEVEIFEKLEIGINLPEEAKIKITNFVKTGRGLNPFDPEQIRIWAEFIHYDNLPYSDHYYFPNCEKTIEAFYYDEFHQEMQDERFKHGYWKKDSTSFNFRIRFAPQKVGMWSCNIYISVGNEIKYRLPKFNFNCYPGKSDGFITGVSENKRLLQFENGKNFFGIGQNIPIADMPNAIVPKGLAQTREQPPMGFTLQREYISDLAANGGNLVRIMHGEWADALEWEKLNDYSMNMNFAWEFDQTVNLCHEKNIYILWLQQVHTAFMARNPYNNDALAWPMNPYHVYLKLEKPEDFFTSEEAMKHYKNKLRYMLSRWGYSRMICGIQPMSELNEMAANVTDSPAHHPYFTDTTFRNDVGKWFIGIKNYIQKDLGYEFLIGSSFTGDLGDFVGDDMIMKNADFNDYHPYGQNRNRNIGARFGGMNTIPGYGVFERHPKPIIHGEMGTWDTEFFQECHENEFHNDLWATAFMGGWAGGLHWHNWEDNFNKDLRKNFKGLSEFLQKIRLVNSSDFKPECWPYKNINDSLYSEKKNNYFESIYMVRNKNKSKGVNAFGWVHNRSAYWYNYVETDCEKKSAQLKSKSNLGKKQFRPFDDDQSSFEKYEGDENIKKRNIKLKGLPKFRKFAIEWFDTVTGEVIVSTKEYHFIGQMKISIPDEINNQKYQDLAFRMCKKSCYACQLQVKF